MPMPKTSAQTPVPVANVMALRKASALSLPEAFSIAVSSDSMDTSAAARPTAFPADNRG